MRSISLAQSELIPPSPGFVSGSEVNTSATGHLENTGCICSLDFIATGPVLPYPTSLFGPETKYESQRFCILMLILMTIFFLPLCSLFEIAQKTMVIPQCHHAFVAIQLPVSVQCPYDICQTPLSSKRMYAAALLLEIAKRAGTPCSNDAIGPCCNLCLQIPP